MLNADVSTTLATFAANTALAGAVNASLEAINLPQFSRRAPIVQGRPDIEFDGVAFIYVLPVVTEIEPDAETQIEPEP